MSDGPKVPRAIRPRWKVEQRLSALLAMSALAPGCAGRSYDGDEKPPINYPPPNEYSPVSDPVGEPAMYGAAPDFRIETAWLNGRQLVVHVVWGEAQPGPRGEAMTEVLPSGTAPKFMIDGFEVVATDGPVPHLAPSPPDLVAPPPTPPGQTVSATIVTEKFAGAEPAGGYWFLVRGLMLSRNVVVQLVFETNQGPITMVGTLSFAQVGGPVQVSVTSR